MNRDPRHLTATDYDYPCPSCGSILTAERFGSEVLWCTCGAGPFETEHDCDPEGEWCTDMLVDAERKS